MKNEKHADFYNKAYYELRVVELNQHMKQKI